MCPTQNSTSENPSSKDYIFVDEDLRHRYLIQIGKGPKGSYRTKYTSDRTGQAELLYRGINIGLGYKKRMIDTTTGKVIARSFS